MEELVKKACQGDKTASKAVRAYLRERCKQADSLAVIPTEVPVESKFFEFAYSDEGRGDPLAVLLEREELDGLTLERITVGTHTTIAFTYHDKE